MQRSTFKVLFYVKRQSEKSGQVPVMGRITINGTMSQFSCKLSVRSSLWDAKANKAAGRSLESQRINEKLENIKTNIGKQYRKYPLKYMLFKIYHVFIFVPDREHKNRSRRIYGQ